MQTISIATQSAVPPLRASRLRTANQTGHLSLRTVRDQVQARPTFMLVQVRDASILKASSSFAELQTNWSLLNSDWVPSQSAMANLINFLNSAGVTVSALSRDWRTMWLSGPAGAFCAVQGALVGDAIDTVRQPHVPHTLDGNAGEVLGGLAIIGATCIAIAPVAAAGVATVGVLYVVGVGLSSLVAGVLIGDGALGLVTSQPPTVTTSPIPVQTYDTTGTTSDGGVQDATVYGADSTAAAQQIITASSTATPVTANSLPPQPVVAPICPTTPVCPVSTPVCPATLTPLGPVTPTTPTGPEGTSYTCPVCPAGPPVCPSGGIDL